MSKFKITAEKRELTVRNPFKKSKRENYIAAVVYNANFNEAIRLKRDEFQQMFNHSKSNTIFEIDLDGKKYRAFVKDVSFSLDRRADVAHVDFYCVDDQPKVRILVPFIAKGTAKGLRVGGHVENYERSVWVDCEGSKIPEAIEHDISDLDLGQRLYLRDVQKGQKVKLVGASDLCFLGVVASRKAVSEGAAGMSSESGTQAAGANSGGKV